MANSKVHFWYARKGQLLTFSYYMGWLIFISGIIAISDRTFGCSSSDESDYYNICYFTSNYSNLYNWVEGNILITSFFLIIMGWQLKSNSMYQIKLGKGDGAAP